MNVTVVVTVALISLSGVEARLAQPLGEVLQPGDVGELFYELRIGGDSRTIAAGTVEVTASNRDQTLVRVAASTEARTGYQARFEVPLARLSPADLERLAEASTESLSGPEASAVAVESPPAVRVVPGRDAPVLGVLEAWRSAWQRQDVASYLACYASDFEPEEGASLEEWREIRAARLRRPAFIEIELVGIEVDSLPSGDVRLTFEQLYRSDGFSDAVRKELILARQDAGWRIRRERSLP